MIALIGNKDEKEIRVLRGSLLMLGYPAFYAAPTDREASSSALAAVVFDGGEIPPIADPERAVLADRSALASDAPGAAARESLRVKERIDEVLEIKSGVRFDNFVTKTYAERNGVSVFLGGRLPLTERDRLSVRLLSVYPGRSLPAGAIAAACFPGPVSDGAVRTAVYGINKKAKTLTGFPLIKTKPNDGYSFGG